MSDTISMRGPGAPPPRRARGDSLIGIDLQGYVITRAISSGGMGVVYEANHSLIGQRAAVKVMRPEYSEDPDLIARFLSEARSISAIKHRNIVEILNFGVLPGGGQFMMMEFLEGATLSEVIAQSAPMPPAVVMRICEELLSGLAAAHQVGVVHRDLKPANVMLSKQSNDELMVKICDFGLARHFDTSAEPASPESLAAARANNASILAGTPEYISPEQASGRTVDGQADLYCLGVILFEMLTGRLPFQAETSLELLQMHCSAVPPRVSDLVPGVPPQLDAFVELLMSKAPGSRPLGAKAARDAVRKLRGSGSDAAFWAMGELERPLVVEAPLADTVMRLAPAKKKKRSAAVIKTVGGLAAAAAVVLGVIAFTAPSETAAAAVPVPAEAPKRVGRAPAQIVTPIEPVTPKPVVQQPIAAPPRARAPRKELKGWPAESACVSDEAWRREQLDQIEHLEQVALATVPDGAGPTQSAEIKSRARGFTSAVRSAQGAGCAQIAAQLQAWQRSLP